MRTPSVLIELSVQPTGKDSDCRPMLSRSSRGVTGQNTCIIAWWLRERQIPESSRQLNEGPGLLGGLRSDPSLEGCRMSLVCACHDAPRNGTVISDQFNIPSGPVLGVHLTLGRSETRPVLSSTCSGSQSGQRCVLQNSPGRTRPMGNCRQP